MKPELDNCVSFTDATTNKNLALIHLDRWSQDTIERMVIDIFNKDAYKYQHGIIIQFGIG